MNKAEILGEILRSKAEKLEDSSGWWVAVDVGDYRINIEFEATGQAIDRMLVSKIQRIENEEVVGFKIFDLPDNLKPESNENDKIKGVW